MPVQLQAPETLRGPARELLDRGGVDVETGHDPGQALAVGLDLGDEPPQLAAGIGIGGVVAAAAGEAHTRFRTRTVVLEVDREVPAQIVVVHWSASCSTRMGGWMA